MAALTVGGIILCGGQSKRMGRPKASLPFGDETMLQRVVRILGEVVKPIVVVAARDQDLPALPTEASVMRDEETNHAFSRPSSLAPRPYVTVVRDAEKGRGPLQGLAAGLLALRGRTDAAYVSSCDVPFLKPGFVARLISFLGDAAICVPKVGGYFHPLAAVYRLDVLDAVSRLLEENRLTTTFLLEEVPTRVVTEAELMDVDETLQSLRNLNCPEDYEVALREFLSALASKSSTTSAAD
jgi:molybdenum cofactor guanylyltransferase